MLFASDPVGLHEFKVCFELLTLLFNLGFDHLDCLFLELLLFSVPVSKEGLLFLFQPAFVLKVPIQLIQVQPIDRCIHSELKFDTVHILLSCRMLTLPLVLIENSEEAPDLRSCELLLDFFRAEQLDLDLRCG